MRLLFLSIVFLFLAKLRKIAETAKRFAFLLFFFSPARLCVCFIS